MGQIVGIDLGTTNSVIGVIEASITPMTELVVPKSIPTICPMFLDR